MGDGEGRGLALVTGASRGIGAATVRALAAASFRVIAGARDRAALDRLAAEIGTGTRTGTGAEALTLDVTDDDDLARLDGREIDLAVLNAGVITSTRPFHQQEMAAARCADRRLRWRVRAHGREDEVARRLATIPGIGVINATALVAALGDARSFGRGRDLAAWLGLTPRQATTGGKPRMLGISKRGNRYLRGNLIHGARAVLPGVLAQETPLGRWARAGAGAVAAGAQECRRRGAGSQAGADRLGRAAKWSSLRRIDHRGGGLRMGRPEDLRV